MGHLKIIPQLCKLSQMKVSDYKKSSNEPKKYIFVAIGWEIGPSLMGENWWISPEQKKLNKKPLARVRILKTTDSTSLNIA